MKEEEKIIKNTIKRTKEYDRTLSPYACKTSECQKLRKEESEHEEFDIRWPLKKILIVFYIVNLINVTPIKHRLFHFFKVHIFLNVQSMFNGFHVLLDK